MNSTPSPNPYESIEMIPSYMDFEFQFNEITAVIIISLSYNIPCTLVFLKTLFFYMQNRKAIQKSGLRVEIFQAFILMQLFNLFLIISEFLQFRIPFTGLVTRFCASENPKTLLKLISFFNYFTLYSSQLLTVLFCALRVAILFSMSESTTRLVKTVFLISYGTIFLIGFVSSLPHYLSEGVCVQMMNPFPFGSIIVVDHFSIKSSNVTIENMVFISFVCVAIVILKIFMFRKLRQRKTLDSNSQKTITQNANIEKTLTRTMIILLIPLLFLLVLAVSLLCKIYISAPSLLSLILMLRPVLLDLRVHTVTLYFYFTHPIFSNAKITTKVVGSQSVKL
ncbi:hypothetical protein CAEBREN_15353 [Caenorhabditis brenneri]|uniref:Serpentine Receptor, class U n=1 Tax=Caenorhabditis brenneri TaxID=135651 RepID=G0M8A2_CAEBE|nr:hypothetical protein CAEBREN_15353 [Caenorhabditis brenneri]